MSMAQVRGGGFSSIPRGDGLGGSNVEVTGRAGFIGTSG